VKIGHILDDRLDKPDGVQQVVRCIGEWARAQGHDVHYIVGETQNISVVPNVHAVSKNLRVKFNGNALSIPLPTSQRKLRTLMAELDLDVLHVHVPYSPFMGAKAIKVSKQCVGITGTFHVLPYNFFARWGNRLLGLWLHSSLKRFDSLYGGTPASAEFAEWSMGIPAGVIGHPLDIRPFQQAITQRPQSGKLRIVFLGRLVPRKGALQLVRAVASLPKHLQDRITVHIGGRGELSKHIVSFVADHGLADVIHLDGFIEESDKPAYLAGADIAVFPSIAGESFGISLLEPMAAGAGITVGGNNPGYSAVLADWPEALFDPKDIRSFATYLEKLVNDSDLRERVGKAQQQTVQQYDINKIGKRWLEIYQAAIDAKAAGVKQ
jgi:phosphatidylinositol alpha-mannosyltransferase